jgi:hypothetical protein
MSTQRTMIRIDTPEQLRAVFESLADEFYRFEMFEAEIMDCARRETTKGAADIPIERKRLLANLANTNTRFAKPVTKRFLRLIGQGKMRAIQIPVARLAAMVGEMFDGK